MKLVACAAAALILIAASAPTPASADTDPDNAMNHYNEGRARGATAARRAAPGKPAVRPAASFAGGGAPWIAVAQRYKGTNPTGRKSLWCADFLNLVLKRSGMKGTSSSMARSFASYGQRLSGPKVGAIAVLARGKTGGHVGIVTGVDGGGNPILISGNHNNRVAEATYPRSRVIAYVWPTS